MILPSDCRRQRHRQDAERQHRRADGGLDERPTRLRCQRDGHGLHQGHGPCVLWISAAKGYPYPSTRDYEEEQ